MTFPLQVTRADAERQAKAKAAADHITRPLQEQVAEQARRIRELEEQARRAQGSRS